MKSDKPNGKHRLLIQYGGLFNCPYEWCIVDFVFWKSNTRANRRWTCCMKPIQETTPVKRIETITAGLDRLCERGMGFSKIPFNTQRRRYGKGRQEVEVRQSFQYIFDAKLFEQWLEKQPKTPIRKRIDPYPKADSHLSENGQQSYPKADTIIRKEEVQKKEIKEGVGSQPPSMAAVAPEPQMNLADEFEKFFQDATGVAPVPSGPSSGGSQPAEGGVPVGIPSTAVAPSSSSTTIQGACGNSNAGGTNETDNGLVSVSAPTIQASASGKTNTGAPDNNAGHPGASAQRAAGTIAKSGGVRGAVPKAVVEHAELVLRQMKKSTRLTKDTIEVVERELWKGLSAYKWSQYPIWSDPRQEVNGLKDKLVREFGQYE